jgi:hypothetical protein
MTDEEIQTFINTLSISEVIAPRLSHLLSEHLGRTPFRRELTQALGCFCLSVVNVLMMTEEENGDVQEWNVPL